MGDAMRYPPCKLAEGKIVASTKMVAMPWDWMSKQMRKIRVVTSL